MGSIPRDKKMCTNWCTLTTLSRGKYTKCKIVLGTYSTFILILLTTPDHFSTSFRSFIVLTVVQLLRLTLGTSF